MNKLIGGHRHEVLGVHNSLRGVEGSFAKEASAPAAKPAMSKEEWAAKAAALVEETTKNLQGGRKSKLRYTGTSKCQAPPWSSHGHSRKAGLNRRHGGDKRARQQGQTDGARIPTEHGHRPDAGGEASAQDRHPTNVPGGNSRLRETRYRTNCARN